MPGPGLAERDIIPSDLLSKVELLERRIRYLEDTHPGAPGETAGKLAHYRPSNGAQYAPSDLYPDTESSAGLFRRLVNRAGLTAYNDHFRSGSMPTGFAWAGAPFVTPASITWNWAGSFLKVTCPASEARAFWYDAITTWQNKRFILRWAISHYAIGGIRFDDGSDSNYIEVVLSSPRLDGTWDVMRQQSGQADVTIISKMPATEFVVLDMYAYAPSPPTWTLYAYWVLEESTRFVVTSLGMGSSWAPSRVGIIIDGGLGTGQFMADWFSSDFS